MRLPAQIRPGRRARGAACVAALWGLCGCGPVTYIATVPVGAARAVAAARAAGAEERAPYEYWSAVAYLRMAREKFGPADYQLARKYGKKAIAMAEAAKRIALEAVEGGGTAPGPTSPTPAAPAAKPGTAGGKPAGGPAPGARPPARPRPEPPVKVVLPPPPGEGG